MSNSVRYVVRNWSQYNEALRSRGDLTLWWDPFLLSSWHMLDPARPCRRGAPTRYSPAVIEAALAVRCLYRLPLRATEGLMRSMLKLLGSDLDAPDYSTICRRQRTLDLALPQIETGEPLHLLIDSTGLKVSGDGEWRRRKYGVDQRRTWRKLHLAVDHKSREIVAARLTDSSTGDAPVACSMLLDIQGEISKVSADGAYDTWEVRYRASERGAQTVIPPRKTAILSGGSAPHVLERNEAVAAIAEVGAAEWKSNSGYHRRSLAETAMFRLKRSFGDEMLAKEIQNQIAEAIMKSRLLNEFIRKGLPQTEVEIL